MEATNVTNNPYLPNPSTRASHPMTVHGSNDPNALINQFQNMALGGMNMAQPPAHVHMPPSYLVGSDAHLLLAQMQNSQSMQMHENGYNHFPIHGTYANPYLGVSLPMLPFTPGRAAVPHQRPDRGHSEVPGLENRRGSYSTNESTPATPFYGSTLHREPGPRVASHDRSSYTTPSPQQLAAMHGDAPGKQTLTTITDRAIDELLKKEPAIPKAVPAVFTPLGQMKTLEQSLENRIPGNRNVYIRGLHPTTDDELLYHYTSRFGAVETSKAILDTNTGACKG